MPLRGVDYHKPSNPRLPSAMGLCTSISFIITIFIFLIFQPKDIIFYKYLAISSSTTFTVLLGFIDDVLDLEWRYKIIFPAISIIPTLLLYNEGTHVMLPFFGFTNIGIFYYFYMIVCCIFSTNAINILSGINGLEVGQVIVISFFIMIDNFLKGNILGITVPCILIFASMPLLLHNKYPAKGFVGNNFCYFSGITLSCVAILTHATRTLYALMGIQILNFIISIPQLIGLIECPRHRMPGFDGRYLISSMTKYKNKPIRNLTVLNVILFVFGRMMENELLKLVIVMQIMWSGFVILFKYIFLTTYLLSKFNE